MSQTVYLVDGTFELFRCFHATPRHTNAGGKEVGAVRGLLHTLLSLLKGNARHVAVAFDALPASRGTPTGDVSALIRSQASLALEAVRALGITLWPMVRFQADDALATGARVLRTRPDVDQVVLCTTDTDLFQCIRDNRVVVLDRIHRKVTDEAAFRQRYDIAPWQFPDYMALVGVPSKGIPGVPGCGKRTVARLLGCYPTVEAIPLEPHRWPGSITGRERLVASLAAHGEEALLVKRLAQLRDDLPLDCSLDALAWRGLDQTRLNAVVAETEAWDLRPRVERWRNAGFA